MQENNSMYRIYSRKRLNIFNKKKQRNKAIQKKINTTRPIFVVFIIALLFCYFVWKSVDPVFNELCIEEAKHVATMVTNEESTKVMDKYGYNDLFRIEKDETGELQLVSANVLVINQITSDISTCVQKALENYENGKVKLPLGILSGNKLLAGSLPDVKIKLSTAGNVATELKSEFVSQGTNQTLHRVYLQIDSNINVITPYNVTKAGIQNQVLLLENVIVGDFGTMGTYPFITNEKK